MVRVNPYPQSTGEANCSRLNKYSIFSSGNNIKFLPRVWGLLIGHNILHEAHKVIITPYPQHIMLWIRCKWVLINIFRSFSSSELTPTKLHLKNCTKSQFIISLNPQLNFMPQVLSRYWRLRLLAHLCLQKVLAQNPTWNQPPKILHLPTIAPWKSSDSTNIFLRNSFPFTQSYKIVIEMKLCDLLASNLIHSSPSKVDSNNITQHT